jgi:hypothetical protein
LAIIIDHRDLGPIVPEWDVNSVFVHKVANVQEWSGAADGSEEDQRLVFGCVKRSHWIGSRLYVNPRSKFPWHRRLKILSYVVNGLRPEFFTAPGVSSLTLERRSGPKTTHSVETVSKPISPLISCYEYLKIAESRKTSLVISIG